MNNKKFILENWNIDKNFKIEEVDSYSQEVSIIVTSTGEKFVLKGQKKIERIKKETTLLLDLKHQNLPVAAPIKNKKGGYYVEDDNLYYALYPFLDGESFSDHYSKDAIKKANLLGEIIGDLHNCLKNVNSSGYEKMNLVSNVLNWAKNVIENNQEYFDLKSVTKIINCFEENIAPLYDSLPKQLIHRDIHPGNILFTNGKLSGIVDFELAIVGPRVFDPCYCTTSMLVGDFEDSKKREKWIDLLLSLLEGYKSKVDITKEEIKSIIYILFAIQLIFMAFSCTTNNIDAAKCNERVLKWLYENRESIKKKLLVLYN
ncbi:phosphotransferase enzyme family protein [Thermohalobacter berrensis]|uniref:Protein kinase domain-containing protein n=1 Tax=Thermohalobacter berrensis TaxID=99594 RepID=A0A419T9Q6_9FIRM|nr:phosphotransferase [Thermohalobacter berrensis]RKD34196.1 hypothetical protein BET03_07860 [Thermohalobacter berrensis]